MIDKMIRHEINKVKLTLSRLNGMWSFTGEELDWRVEFFLKVDAPKEWEALLLAVRAYGCLAARVGEVVELHGEPPAEWSRLFKDAGQALMFNLPECLHAYDMKLFNKECSETFMLGYRGAPLPSLPV